MIDDIITHLKNSQFPPDAALQKWFEIALIKKMGVINLPHLFWHSDKKINPPAKYLLWAAILLEDQGKYCMVEGIIHTETQALTPPDSKNFTSDPMAASREQNVIASYINELLGMCQDPAFQNRIAAKIKRVLPAS
jgi:hypothetical protein